MKRILIGASVLIISTIAKLSEEGEACQGREDCRDGLLCMQDVCGHSPGRGPHQDLL